MSPRLSATSIPARPATVVRFVMCVDDLDRRTNGKSVQVLEAVQLLFNEAVPDAGGPLADHGGWLVLWAKAAVAWRRFKAAVARFFGWLCCCLCHGSSAGWSFMDSCCCCCCSVATSWSAKDAGNTVNLGCCGIGARSTTSKKVKRLTQLDDRDAKLEKRDLEKGFQPDKATRRKGSDDGDDDKVEMWDKPPLMTVFVSFV